MFSCFHNDVCISATVKENYYEDIYKKFQNVGRFVVSNCFPRDKH